MGAYVKSGGEFLVNVQTAGDQSEPNILSLPNGGFAVEWYDTPLGGNQQSTSKGMLFQNNGGAIGGENILSSLPSVRLTDGRFLALSVPSDYHALSAQFFDAQLHSVGNSVTLKDNSANTSLLFGASSAAALASGGFVAGWEVRNQGNSSFYLQRFDANGNAVGQQQLVGTGASPSTNIELTSLQGSGYAALWQENGGTFHFQLFNDDGTAITSAVTVDASGNGMPPTEGQIVGLANGGVAIVWDENFSAQGFQGVSRLQAQAFDSAGHATSSDITIDHDGPAQIASKDVAALPSGEFVVVWAKGNPGGTTADTEIDARIFTPTGAEVGTEQVVNNIVSGTQIQPSVAALTSGGFVVSWTDGSGAAPDRDGRAIRAQLFSHIDGPGHHPHNDFNGDGRSDILWRSDSGALSDWLANANGGFAGNDGNAYGTVPTSWKMAGTGDFNGDGRSDILWRNSDGSLSDWLANSNGGFAANDANAFTKVATSWHVVSTGDFNGDGREDLLWRSDSGALSDWLANANGGFASNDANAYTTVSTSWKVAGTGDFNGDGREDILWRSDSGALSDWLANANGGFTSNDANAYATAPISWHIAGTGDFNGDGREDILWRSDSGALSDWLANANGGFTSNDANAYTTAPTNWHIAGTGDYNGDGREDILWRSDSGALSDWLANTNGGFAVNDANAHAQVSTDWHIQAHDYLIV